MAGSVYSKYRSMIYLLPVAEMHTQAAPLPSYHIPGGFEQLYQRSTSLNFYSNTDEPDHEYQTSDTYFDANDYPDCIYGKLYKTRCLSGSLSSSQSDDSLEGRNQSLEDSHFQKALNSGVFNSTSAYNKRERKRSFRRVRKKSHSESSCESFDDPKIPAQKRHELLFCSRALSGSSNLGVSHSEESEYYHRTNSNTSSRPRRKESIPKRGERFRKELSSCGIDLHDANDKMDIEEIYQLQERFFTGLKIRGDSELDNDCVNRTSTSPPQRWIKKKRCASSIN
jgi:hypothetical protein